MVADRHRLAAYHNNHCWRAFRGYQHRWPWMTLSPQNRGFKWFFCYFRLRRTLRVNFRWNTMYRPTGYRPRQPEYEIKLMLWRVSWALAQISCITRFSDSKTFHYVLPSGGLRPRTALFPQTSWLAPKRKFHAPPMVKRSVTTDMKEV